MIDTRRHGVGLALVLASGGAAALLACGDDTEIPAVTAAPGRDAATPPVDDASMTPPTTNDGGADANNAPDAGPTATRQLGATGRFQVPNDGIFVSFFEDDTIVRWSNAPGCVLHVRAESKPLSAAGVVTVGGPVVGTPGGLPAQVQLQADPATYGTNQYIYPNAVYAADGEPVVQIGSAEFAPSFPLLPATALRPFGGTVTVTAPAVPDGGTLLVPSTAPLAITWTPPTTTNVATQHFIVSLYTAGTALGAKSTLLSCRYPLGSGSGAIPANVLADVKAYAADPNATGSLAFTAGGYAEVATGSASYVIEVARNDSTTWPANQSAKIQ